jgi:hypothetical protein
MDSTRCPTCNKRMIAAAIDANGRTKLQCVGGDYAAPQVRAALAKPLAR